MEQVTWVNSRKLKFSSLVVQVRRLKMCAGLTGLAAVRKLRVVSHNELASDMEDGEQLQKVCAMLPSLTSVDMSSFSPPNSNYLATLASSRSPLNTILLDCALSSCTGVDSLIHYFSATLTCLHLGDRRAVDPATLLLIACHCHKLKALNMVCQGITTQEFAMALGSKHLPCLERIGLRNLCPDLSAVNDDLALAIFQHHPMLAALVARDGSVISLPFCAEIISTHRLLTNVGTSGWDYEVITNPSTLSKHSEIVLNDCEGNRDASSIIAASLIKLSQCGPPIKLFDYADRLLVNDDLRDVLSVLGKDLKIFTCSPNGTIDDDNIVHHITVMCPYLESLYLNRCSAITDQSLLAIANNCQFVTRLCLHLAPLITDSGIWCLLDALGGRLTTFILSAGCQLLTSASLDAIVLRCTNLKILEINKTGISLEAIKTKIIIPNKLPLLEKFHLMRRDYLKLETFVSDASSAVDKRWMSLLDHES